MDTTMMPKIADFGLSRILDPLKSQTRIHGTVAGSLGYMAPEYLLEGVVSPKADVFSLGKIFMEIVTGQRDCP
ncbi:hypothetical protein HU200_004520 [Digitaria exilis]|uniref:Protein kinase domain-containing protein n=1 Tax=Digitaria exilis TaxID=1010633 RepID=A0A835FVR0_9POAL|nr:hypothetical protein HU200_004520 [Digitaria exilis]